MRTSEAPVHAAMATITTMRMAAIQIQCVIWVDLLERVGDLHNLPLGNDSRDQTRWTSRDLLPAFSSPPWGRSALRVPERASGPGDNEVLAGDADLRHDLLDARHVRAWVSGHHRDEAT